MTSRASGPPSSIARRAASHPVLAFVLLAYGISYVVGAPLLVAGLSTLPTRWVLARAYLPRVLVVYGPGLAALLLARATRPYGDRALLRRLAPSARDVSWASGILVAGVAASVGALRVAGVRWAELLAAVLEHGVLLAVHVALQLIVVAVGEELGWRGWLLPRMLERTTRLRAALAVAVIWGLWHGPLLVSSVATTAMFLVGVVGLSVLFAWLWAEASGRLFTVVVAHAAVNAPLFFWEQVTTHAGASDPRLRAAWYALEAGFAGAAVLLVCVRWRWWSARSGAGA